MEINKLISYLFSSDVEGLWCSSLSEGSSLQRLQKPCLFLGERVVKFLRPSDLSRFLESIFSNFPLLSILQQLKESLQTSVSMIHLCIICDGEKNTCLYRRVYRTEEEEGWMDGKFFGSLLIPRHSVTMYLLGCAVWHVLAIRSAPRLLPAKLNNPSTLPLISCLLQPPSGCLVALHSYLERNTGGSFQ